MKNISGDAHIISADTVSYLDVQTPAQSYTLRPDISNPEQYAFVQVEIGTVYNPALRSVIFNVFYREGQNNTLLGSFSMYPPDNPGTFIVPTQAKLKAGATVVISMQLPDDVRKGDTLAVGIKAVRLLRR